MIDSSTTSPQSENTQCTSICSPDTNQNLEEVPPLPLTEDGFLAIDSSPDIQNPQVNNQDHLTSFGPWPPKYVALRDLEIRPSSGCDTPDNYASHPATESTTTIANPPIGSAKINYSSMYRLIPDTETAPCPIPDSQVALQPGQEVEATQRHILTSEYVIHTTGSKYKVLSFNGNTQFTSIPRSNRPIRLRCDVVGCSYKGLFGRRAELTRHINTKHRHPASFFCPHQDCYKLFNRKDNLKDHLRRMHS
ncbi:hypothetical protein BDV28DRAFT_149508 [Aspergillus coremiiformis]|uniref:C2H2-type domain-containing protein n=1 Tax=Aspergillus coremiiformis TaxID=138285 RepID=A0A5N6Z3F4_9EURO|nr:hypothetical protein BDV28DRAFT_149508 [Aspergillus coremiiformis]